MPRQYVAVEFHPGDRRTYTYTNDGEPVAVGDKVVVVTNKGESIVTVTSLSTKAPPFACKPIKGKAPPREKPVETADAEPLSDDIGF